MNRKTTPQNGPAGTTSQMPRWEGPEESRPSGYLPAKDNPETEGGADDEATRDSERDGPGDAGKGRQE